MIVRRVYPVPTLSNSTLYQRIGRSFHVCRSACSGTPEYIRRIYLSPITRSVSVLPTGGATLTNTESQELFKLLFTDGFAAVQYCQTQLKGKCNGNRAIRKHITASLHTAFGEYYSRLSNIFKVLHKQHSLTADPETAIALRHKMDAVRAAGIWMGNHYRQPNTVLEYDDIVKKVKALITKRTEITQLLTGHSDLLALFLTNAPGSDLDLMQLGFSSEDEPAVASVAASAAAPAMI